MIAGENTVCLLQKSQYGEKTIFSGKVLVLQGICTQSTALPALCGTVLFLTNY